MADEDRYIDGANNVGKRTIPDTGQYYDQDGKLTNIETYFGTGDGPPGPKPVTDFGDKFVDGSESVANRIIPKSGQFYGEDGMPKSIEEIFAALGGGQGGVTVHNQLSGRSATNCHPISSITDLPDKLKYLTVLQYADVMELSIAQLNLIDDKVMTPKAMLEMISKILSPTP